MFYAAPHKAAPQEGGFYFMKIKISNAITAALCAAVLSTASYSLGYADADTGGGTGYSSQGKIVFDNGTEDTADDVIFDASDFRLIDDMVTEGKTNIKNELNQYGNIQIDDDIPEFGTLAASVSAISDGTDAAAGNILSGKKALVGKNIVTGSMADHSGTSTSTSQIKENGTTAEITIPGGYYDENSKITIPIDVIKDLPAINSNLLPGTVLYDNSSVSSQVESSYGASTASLTYTFTKDYSSVMVFPSGGHTSYILDSSTPPGIWTGETVTVTCTSGTVENKNGYFLIKNAKKGSTVTATSSGVSSGYYHKHFLHMVILG